MPMAWRQEARRIGGHPGLAGGEHRAGHVLFGYLAGALALGVPAWISDSLRGIGWHLLPGLELVVLLAGWRYAPGLALGPLLVHALDPLPGRPATLGLWVAVQVLGALLGALVLRTGLGIDPRLRRPRDLNALVVVALLQPLPVALLGGLIFVGAGHLPASSFPADVVAWWIGNAIGTLTLAPALLVHGIARIRGRPAGPRGPGREADAQAARAGGQGIETGAQVASLLAAIWVPFGSPIAHEVRLLYLGFLPLLWIALRRGLAGATLAVLVLNVGTIVATRTVATPPAGLADLQLLLLGFALTGLFLGAMTTARRQAEAALRASEARFRAVFDRALDALVMLADDGRFLAANPAAGTLLGVPASGLPGAEMLDFAAPRQRRALRRAWQQLLARGEDAGTLELVRADGTRRRVEYAASAHVVPGRHLAILRDVTERVRLEGALRRAQRTEALGRLAGGVAHHFNNLLAVILGYAETLAKDLPGDDPLRHDAEEIRTAAGRAAALTRQLLAFSRRQALQPRPLDVTELLAAMAPALRGMLGGSIELGLGGTRLRGTVHADAGQVRQAIVNLVVNARDAMPGGGRLAIETADVELDAAFARTHPGVTPGPHVAVRVRDTGDGMPAAVLAHACEPFFTTRDVGQGAGLGLASVYGIVRQHHGAMDVESAPGRGTTVTLYFPCLRTPGGAGETRTVLLVMDDPSARQSLRGVLVREGHTVLEASNAGEALFIADWHEDPIDLLLVAADLPQLPGAELAARLRAARPEMRVLALVEAPAGPAGLAPAPGPTLVWPASAETVARAIDAALAGPLTPA